jgi:hypothetical protein
VGTCGRRKSLGAAALRDHAEGSTVMFRQHGIHFVYALLHLNDKRVSPHEIWRVMQDLTPLFGDADR